MVVIVVDDLVGGASVDEGFEENSSDVRDESVIFIVVVRIVEIFGIVFDSQMHLSRGRRIFQ